MGVVHFLYQGMRLHVNFRDNFPIAASQLRQCDWQCDMDYDDCLII